jgi:pimeloyl-ACP methyl ester carboxylesterase
VNRWLVLTSIAAIACGDNNHHARLLLDFSADAPVYGRAPFPSDAWREGPRLGFIRGLDGMARQHADLIAQHLQSLDGFGLRPTIEFFVHGAIDEATVPALTRDLTDALMVLDVDPQTSEAGAPVPYEWRYDAERNVIVGAPALGTQLREGTIYAAVLTTDVHGLDGMPVFGAFELARLDNDPPQRWKTTAQAYTDLRTLPALATRIAGLAVFTTQTASDALVKARNVIGNTGAVPKPTLTFDDPALIFDTASKLTDLLGQAARHTTGARAGLEQWGTDNETGMAHDHIAVIATGTTTTARFRGDDCIDATKGCTPDGADDETFTIGGEGVPDVHYVNKDTHEVDKIPVTIVLPKGTVPATGFPVVVFGHGLGGSRHSMLNLAEPLAAQGYAVIGIDMWGHGSRYNPIDVGNNLGGKPGFTGDRALRDGFGDDTGLGAYLDFFEGFLNISAIRDSIRQSTLDVARVAQLVQTNPSLAALAAPYASTPKLDPTRVAYLGESFGTIVGTNLAAIEPSIALYVLDVPGGGLVDHIFPNSPYIADLALSFAEILYGTTGKLDKFHPLVGTLQALFDAGDSLTFARHVLKDRFTVENQVLGRRHVVCLEVMHDEVMPNIATEGLARGLGLQIMKPNLAPPAGMLQIESPASGNVNSQTAVLVQYSPATHGYNWSAQAGKLEYVPGGPAEGDDPFPKLANPITIQEPIYETLDQVIEILATHFAAQTPRVRSTHTPVADFDGDGRPDASDPDPFDPTK